MHTSLKFCLYDLQHINQKIGDSLLPYHLFVTAASSPTADTIVLKSHLDLHLTGEESDLEILFSAWNIKLKLNHLKCIEGKEMLRE